METVMVIQKSPTTPVVQQTPRTLYKEPQQLVKQQTTRKSQAHLEVQTSNVQTELLAGKKKSSLQLYIHSHSKRSSQ